MKKVTSPLRGITASGSILFNPVKPNGRNLRLRDLFINSAATIGAMMRID